VIRVAFDEPSERARWALDVLLGLLGMPWREVPPHSEAELVYGAARTGARCAIHAGPQTPWDDPQPSLTHRDMPIVHLRSVEKLHVQTEPSTVTFDLVYATYACLTAPWEQVDPVDEVGCPLAGSSWLARYGVLERPLVHEYATRLGGALEAGGIPLTSPRRPSIVLTHDVDSNFAHLFARRESRELLRRDLSAGGIAATRRFAGLVRRSLNSRQQDKNDRWDDWLALTAASGGRPCFFVASYGLFDPKSARHDPPYDARHPEVRATLRHLVAAGAEIGVHFSLQAQTSPSQVLAECERLAEILGAPVRSARHHWWAVGQPAERVLEWHAKAGIEVDCSLGYNDAPGFRRGIAAPFRPFDRRTGRPLPIWELPTIAMDLAVYDGRRSSAEADMMLRRIFTTTAAVGGSFVMDWHAHALNPVRLHGAGQGLRELLNGAARDVPLRTPLDVVA